MTDNLRPHAEARLAMAIWDHEYAFEQKGGSMDFWEHIGARRRRLVVGILDEVLKDLKENGRAPAEGEAK
jgi:hypothetical protein